MTLPAVPAAAELVQITAEDARVLTDRIKVVVEGVWEMVKQAYLTRAWAALGYQSWDDYCTREFGTSRLRLPREERQEIVASLRESGMSVRAIASATGHDRNTIRGDIRQVGEIHPPEFLAPGESEPIPAPEDDQPEVVAAEPEDDQPEEEKITGTDGKTYTKSAGKVSKRPPLPPRFQAAANKLSRVIAEMERLQADDRYRVNRQAIAEHCLPEVRRAASVLHNLLGDLGGAV